MGLINFMADKIRQKMWHFLQVNPAQKSLLIIDENMDFLTSCAKNRIWYAGKSKQLPQLYGQLDVPNTMFWKSKMTSGMEIRKIHIPLASLIVDTIAIIAAIPIMMPNMVRRERILCAQIPWNDNLIFSNID